MARPTSFPSGPAGGRWGDSILFQASQNVGAGIQTPGARLDVVSAGIAVRGTSSGASGTGVVGVNNATSGYASGVYGQSASTSGSGLSGNATAASGYTSSVYGYSASANGTGVYGK